MTRLAYIAPAASYLAPSVLRGQSASLAEPVSQVSSIALSLAVVVALIVFGAWAVRRSPLGAVSRRTGTMKIIATLPVGPKERLVVVEALGRELLIGVSPAGISALHKAETSLSKPAEIPASGADEHAEQSFERAVELAQSRQLASDSR